MDISVLPAFNAFLNTVSAILLVNGYLSIRRKAVAQHKRFMISALIVSSLFLISYITFHSLVGSVPYTRNDWTRPLYFTILIPHIILSALMVIPIITGVFFALRGRFDVHRRIMRFVLPVWLFVSVSGLLIYLMNRSAYGSL